MINFFEKYSIVNFADAKIVKKLQCNLFLDEIDTQISTVQQEIALSNLNLDEIINVLSSNLDYVINFSFEVLKQNKPYLLARGVSITYAILYIYIHKMSEADFINYLTKRGFDNPPKYMQYLQTIIKGL